MGPLSLPKNAADTLEWAQCFYEEMLPIPLHGVKISPRVSQKRLRFGDDVGKRKFIKFAKKYHQRLEEEECASVGRVTVRAMSPPRLADIGVLLQQAEDASRD